MGTRQCVEKTGVAVARRTDEFATGGHDLERFDGLEQAALPMAARGYPDTHAQTAKGEIFHLGLHGEREPPGNEKGGNVAYGGHRLRADDSTLFVNLEDVAEVDGDLVHILLELGGTHRHCLPRLARGAHELAAGAAGPHMGLDRSDGIFVLGVGVPQHPAHTLSEDLNLAVDKAGGNRKSGNEEPAIAGQEVTDDFLKPHRRSFRQE